MKAFLIFFSLRNLLLLHWYLIHSRTYIRTHMHIYNGTVLHTYTYTYKTRLFEGTYAEHKLLHLILGLEKN